jgi:hypothetical protein
VAPYRNDADALREAKETLERELASTRARESEVAAQLASVNAQLAAKTRLPMLDRIRVASPCNASWDQMTGDDRVRFCGSCQKNVFNLSAMPREEAENLLRERSNGELCVRYFQRADGTILTEDCPVGVRKKRRKLAVASLAGAGAVAVAAAKLASSAACHYPIATMGAAPRMGEMAVDETPMPPVPAIMGSTTAPHADPPPQAKPNVVVVKPTGAATPAPHARMGKPALHR